MNLTKSTLHSLIATISRIEEQLSESGGELTPDIEQELNLTHNEIATKVDRYAYVMDRLKALKAMHSNRREFYQRQERGIQKAIDHCEAQVQKALETLNMNEIKGDEYTFTLKPSQVESVLIEDENQIPMEYCTKTPSKTNLKIALMGGIVIPGARLYRQIKLKYNPSIKKLK